MVQNNCYSNSLKQESQKGHGNNSENRTSFNGRLFKSRIASFGHNVVTSGARLNRNTKAGTTDQSSSTNFNRSLDSPKVLKEVSNCIGKISQGIFNGIKDTRVWPKVVVQWVKVQ